jgi:hypothetical protein
MPVASTPALDLELRLAELDAVAGERVGRRRDQLLQRARERVLHEAEADDVAVPRVDDVGEATRLDLGEPLHEVDLVAGDGDLLGRVEGAQRVVDAAATRELVALLDLAAAHVDPPAAVRDQPAPPLAHPQHAAHRRHVLGQVGLVLDPALVAGDVALLVVARAERELLEPGPAADDGDAALGVLAAGRGHLPVLHGELALGQDEDALRDRVVADLQLVGALLVRRALERDVVGRDVAVGERAGDHRAAEPHAVAAARVDVAHQLRFLTGGVHAAVLDREVVLGARGIPEAEAAAAGRRHGAGVLPPFWLTEPTRSRTLPPPPGIGLPLSSTRV